LESPRNVPSVAEEKRASIQVRLDQRKQVRFHGMRRVLNRRVRIEWHDFELICMHDVVCADSTEPLAVGDKNEVFRCQFIQDKSEVPRGRHAFQEHAHRVRVISPTIPWIALPNRIAPFGGGVPGAICDDCKWTRSMVYVSRRTVDNDITRGPEHCQRWRSGRFCREECVGLIVNVPGTEESENQARIEAEKGIQVEMLE